MINFIELECPNCGGGMKRVKHDNPIANKSTADYRIVDKYESRLDKLVN